MTGSGADQGRLRLRVVQFAPTLGAPEENLERLVRAQRSAAEAEVDLVLTPELSLTGYDLRDRAHAVARPLSGTPFPALRDGPDMILGVVERGADSVLYNSAVHLRQGEPLHVHRKVYLPTYGMFDEGRYFGAGDRVRAYSIGDGWRVGLLVCEDLWHPALAWLLAADGAELILVQAAPAGRGVRESGDRGGRFASWDSWIHLASAAAFAYGVYVVVASRVGVEGPVVFAGGSFAVGPDGTLLTGADSLAEEELTLVLSRDAVATARRPFCHARDDDPHLVRRELARILDDRA